MLKSYVAKTDQGPCLQINEDDVHVDLAHSLFLLFDGFGGAGVGDKTVQMIKDNITNLYTKIGGDPDATMPFYYNPRNLIETNALINATLVAHESVMKDNESKQMHERGGASFCGSVLTENILSIVSVGNCMTCLIRDSKVQMITTPDTMTPPWMDTYQPQFYTYPLNAFGLFPQLSYEVKEVRVKKGDVILSFSDGVYSRIIPKDIRELLLDSELKDVEKVNKVLALANERGNRDNQSTILLRF